MFTHGDENWERNIANMGRVVFLKYLSFNGIKEEYVSATTNRYENYHE